MGKVKESRHSDDNQKTFESKGATTSIVARDNFWVRVRVRVLQTMIVQRPAIVIVSYRLTLVRLLDTFNLVTCWVVAYNKRSAAREQ